MNSFFGFYQQFMQQFITQIFMPFMQMLPQFGFPTFPGFPPVGQPPVGQPPVGQPPVGQPPVGQPPVGQPPVGQPPVGQPPVGQPPVGQPPVNPPGSTLEDFNYSTLTREQREQLTGFSDREIAIFHLWGRQMNTVGRQNGAIYNSVLDAIQNGTAADGSAFTAEERQLVQQLAAQEMQQFGGFTGRLLDEEFFKVFQKITGEDISQRFSSRPTHFAGEQRALFPQGAGNVDSESWMQAISQQSGLNDFEQSVMRFWGHDPLFSQGKITGMILPMTLVNPNALDRGNINQQNAQALLEADLADDGVANGSSMARAFNSTLDKLYFGTPGTNVQQAQNQAQTIATQNGRSIQQIQQDMTVGVQNAIENFKSFAQQHPILLAGSSIGLAGASAVCPFFAGVGAVASMAMMAQSPQQQQ